MSPTVYKCLRMFIICRQWGFWHFLARYTHCKRQQRHHNNFHDRMLLFEPLNNRNKEMRTQNEHFAKTTWLAAMRNTYCKANIDCTDVTIISIAICSLSLQNELYCRWAQDTNNENQFNCQRRIETASVGIIIRI